MVCKLWWIEKNWVIKDVIQSTSSLVILTIVKNERLEMRLL